jgi:thymidylate synthase
MGRKTCENIPKLLGRHVVCLRHIYNKGLIKNCDGYINSLEDVHEFHGDENVFIAGGKEVYEQSLLIPDFVKKVHISIMKKVYECDTFIDFKIFNNFIVEEKNEYENFNHYVLTLSNDIGERQYLNLLDKILKTGNTVRGRNGITKSVFGEVFKFDLTKGFPLLTTKKMFLRGIIEELLFFIRGKTNSKILEEKNVNIWKGNTSRKFLDSMGFDSRPEGIMGPLYGYNWRYYGSDYDDIIAKPINPTEGIDQLKELVNSIKTDPHSRRLLISTYNPIQAKEGVLFPCHSLILQFYVDDRGFLDMIAFSRSADMFLGIPFNIASYSLFLTIIAKCTNLVARNLTITIGDAHIYEEHFKVVKEQLIRIPFKFPSLHIKKELKTVEDMEMLSYEDFELENYKHYEQIKAQMIP